MKSIEDLKWLAERMPAATEAQKEMFFEKVAVCLFDAKMTEDEARKLVFSWLVGA